MDAGEFNASLVLGANFADGRGNITAYATVYDGDQVLQRDRDYSACSLNPNPTESFTGGGSANLHRDRDQATVALKYLF